MKQTYRQYEQKDTHRSLQKPEKNLTIKIQDCPDSTEQWARYVVIFLDQSRTEAVFVPFGSLIKINGRRYRLHRGSPFVYDDEKPLALRYPQSYLHHQTACLEGEDLRMYRLEQFAHEPVDIIHLPSRT